MAQHDGPLAGIRVVDLGWVLAGPYATMLLSYLGAEVIKVESRRRVDEQRVVHRAGMSEEVDASSNFFEVNLNKQSVTINLSKPEGADLVKQLVATSDVVIENMRPGVVDRLGLGYRDLVKVKPDIIMASISGWGQAGPLREYTAYAPCFASFGGLAHLTGYADGEPNNGTSAMDARSGTAAAFAVMMALMMREFSGEGQYIDMASGEALSCLIGDQLMDFSMNGRSPSRTGNADPVWAPHNCYRAAGEDRWVSIAVATEDEWSGMVRAMGTPEWALAPEFATAEGRVANRERLDELVGRWTAGLEQDRLTDLLQRHGVAAVPSYDAEQLFGSPHLRERNSIAEVDHPVLGRRMAIAPPFVLSETPAEIYRSAPLLGEHNDYVLQDVLGLSAETISELMDRQVVY